MGIDSVDNRDGGGEWDGVMDWPIIGIHAILTPDNKLLTFGTDQRGMQGGHLIYDVWDIETDTHYTLENQTPTDLFCSVPVLVPETGEILIAGGDTRPLGYINYGVEDVNVYDYTDMSISPSPTGDMAYQRWYPTAINLANGKILMLGGIDGNGKGVGMPELYTPGVGWKSLPGAYSNEIATDWWYPRTWLNSDGNVVAFGTNGYNKNFSVHIIDPSGNGTIETVRTLPFQTNNSLPAIMYEQDKVLVLGVDGSAWIMDISGDVPRFTKTSDVGGGRLWSNLVVLADGSVMVSGGSSVDNELVGVRNAVKIWDPSTGDWTKGDVAEIPRLYHSTTILLPDGSVLSLGGGAPGPLKNTNGEIYYPDYLFDDNGDPAERPVIIDAPHQIEQRQDFSITVDDAGDISRLTLVKAGSVTHSLNMSTTKMDLDFVAGSNNTLQVNVLENANVLTPGQWMLFAFDSKGAPSIAATVQVGLGGEVYQEKFGGFVTLNGNAKFVADDIVSLTGDGPRQKGGIMGNERISIKEDFQISFKVFLGDDDGGADGMAFVLHDGPFGADEVGKGAGGLGVVGIDNGLALEIDTHQNAIDNTANDHTGWMDTDSVRELRQLSPLLDVGNVEDGAWHSVQVDWDAQTQILSYTFDGRQGAGITGDLAQKYFGGSNFVTFGFAAATGGGTNPHRVQALGLQATFEDGSVVSIGESVTIEPAGSADGGEATSNPVNLVNANMGGDVFLNGNATYNEATGIVTLTADAPEQIGSVMAAQRIDLTADFALSFNVFLGTKNAEGADGLVFVLHNDPVGTSALGRAGGLGAKGLENGLALEFDTHQNVRRGDIAQDHSGWFDTENYSAVSGSLKLGNVEDGAWHNAELTWDAETQAMNYSVDGLQGASLTGNLIDTYFGGSDFVYFGFAGATGGSSNLQQVQALGLQATFEDGSEVFLGEPPIA